MRLTVFMAESAAAEVDRRRVSGRKKPREKR